ncbi:MAG: hypothetical protein GC164_08995 [Phycisphaera sp.]|nr:hypothetical protein [Phycisphaera sp.]
MQPKKFNTVITILTVAFLAAVARAGVLSFDPDGSNNFASAIDIQEFDWGVGSILAKNALESPGGSLKPVGSEFTVYYQAKLQGYQLPGGNSSGGAGLPIGSEITVVAGFKEKVSFLSADRSSAVIEVVNDADNFVRIYFDSWSTSGGATTYSQPNTGLGFSDGTLIFDGAPVSGHTTINLNNPDTNKGAFNITAQASFLHADFFPNLSVNDLMLTSAGTVQDFGQVKNGTLFDTLNQSTVPYVAGSNDLVARSDVNSRTELLPEPGTFGLLGMCMMLVAGRRRPRRAA